MSRSTCIIELLRQRDSAGAIFYLSVYLSDRVITALPRYLGMEAMPHQVHPWMDSFFYLYPVSIYIHRHFSPYCSKVPPFPLCALRLPFHGTRFMISIGRLGGRGDSAKWISGIDLVRCGTTVEFSGRVHKS